MHKPLLKEDAHTEFKSSFTDAVIETLAAFANSNGGRVLIGLDDKGSPIKGFTLGVETLQKWVNEVKLKTQPSIIPDVEIVTIAGMQIAELSVKEFPVKPVSFKGRYFKRINNSNHQLSAVEISDLSLQSLQLSWDSYPAHRKTFHDLDLSLVERFIEKVNVAGRFQLHSDAISSLEKLRLINRGQITNAAWLLFGKGNIGYNVHLGRFKTPTFIIDDKMLNGALFQVVEEIMNYLISRIKVAFEIKGMPTQRTEIFEYPLPALREIILNSLIHRDYRSPIDIQIKLFDNEVSFFNPGKLQGDLTTEDLRHDNYRAYARNKLVAEAFYLTGDIEKYGSGFLRIREEIETYPTMKLDFEEIPNGFNVSLRYTEQKISTEKVKGGEKGGEKGVEKGGENLSENQLKIIRAIEDNNRVTYEELAKLIGINVNNIERNVKKLRDLNIIDRIGPAKGGYWKVNT